MKKEMKGWKMKKIIENEESNMRMKEKKLL